MTRFGAALLVAALVLAPPARAQDTDKDADAVGRGEVALEQPADGPFVGEMVLLKFRAVVRGRIANRDVRQPSLVDLDWQQLGRDSWTEIDDRGSRAYALDRTIAIFPRRAGSIKVDPFALLLTLLAADNSRYETEVASDPLVFEARQPPSGEHLVYARSLTVSDAWDKQPDRLASGETARRTVTIEAAGIVAERLPPPPSMRAPGVISFAGPVERSTTLTAEGPVARAVYRWDVKPISGEAATIPAKSIAWFDTASRQRKEATIPAQRISLAAVAAERTASPTPARTANSLASAAAAGVFTLVWIVAAVHLLSTGGPAWLALRRRRVLLKPLRVTVRANDARRFRTALSALVRADARAARACSRDPALRDAVAALDAHLFGVAGSPAPALAVLYRGLETALRHEQAREARADDALASLDAPLAR